MTENNFQQLQEGAAHIDGCQNFILSEHVEQGKLRFFSQPIIDYVWSSNQENTRRQQNLAIIFISVAFLLKLLVKDCASDRTS